jgi:hypothetical protein
MSICKKEEIPVDIALYIASLHANKPITTNTFQSAIARGFVKAEGYDINGNLINPSLTQEGIDVVGSLFLDKKLQPEEKEERDRFEKLAEKLRELYPEGRKAGTSHMWKGSTAIIAKKLRTLVKKYDIQFTDEQAVEATKAYIESFNGDYQYMQVLMYFISKKDLKTGEENSQLLSYLENLGQSDAENNSWKDNVR